MPYTDAHWAAFFEGVGQGELASDPRFASQAARTANIDALYGLLADVVARRPTAEWLAFCEARQIPAGRSWRWRHWRTTRTSRPSGSSNPLDDPGMGRINLTGVPVLFDGARPDVTMPPRRGEHSRDILAEAGVPEEEIERILGSGVVEAKEFKDCAAIAEFATH
jgi:crotonobetainyl-CoA:carnitine CoA-transferase CaiB-like acyl-CoA transferase